MIRKFIFCLLALFIVGVTTSCAAKAFEVELNVVFMYEDEIIAYDTVTQFKNIKSPELTEAYIPDGYKLFGWTWLNPDSIRGNDPNISEKYIGNGKMVHYDDIDEYAENTTVILRPLMIDKAEIPVVYHYVVIAWYDKPATSGVDAVLMEQLKMSLYTYLRANNVSEEDIATIEIRGYTGNVGTSCGQIMEAEDVDIMLGWGSKENVTGTGGMKDSMIKETVSLKVGEKNRTIHRLTDKETAMFVYEWLQSEECKNIFA